MVSNMPNFPRGGGGGGSERRYFPKKLTGANKVTAENAERFKSARKFPTKEERKEKKEKAKQLKRKKWRLIVRNVPFQCTKEDIENSFKKFGVLTEIVIPKKNDHCAGFCFIQFRDFPSAAKALKEQNMKEIKGRTVAVDWALPKDDYLTAVINEKKIKESCEATKQKTVEIKSESDEKQAKEDPLPSTSTSLEEDESSDTGVEEESGSEESLSDEEEETKELKTKDSEKFHNVLPRKEDPGLKEKRTLFVRNLSFDTSNEDLSDFFGRYGELRYAVVCKYPDTEHSKGSGFVQFVEKSDAEKCLEASKVEHPDGTVGFQLDKRRLFVCEAMEKEKAKEMEKAKHEKQPKDKRNLHLLRVGLIRAGTKQANGMSESDAMKRIKVEKVKREKIKNLHIFVSPTRLCFHNLPTRYKDEDLRKICLESVDDKSARLKECRIMRDLKRLAAGGLGKSRGYGFVEFSEHKHALACLQKLNNNSETFSDVKRPIVEFSLENRSALNIKEKRLEKSKARLGAMKGERAEKMGKQPRPPGLEDSVGHFSEKKLTDLDRTKKEMAAGGQKPLPSHLGPKLRHKKREGKKESRDGAVLGKKMVRKDKKSRKIRRKEKAARMNSLQYAGKKTSKKRKTAHTSDGEKRRRKKRKSGED